MSSKKFVIQKVMTSYPTIENSSQCVVRVSKVRGGNMLDVETETGHELLCDIPSRFTKKIWIKRGDYVIIELYHTDPKGKEQKIKGVVVHVLQADSIKHLKAIGQWPSAFDEKIPRAPPKTVPMPSTTDSDEEDDDDQLPSNPNRQAPSFDSDSDEEDSSCEEESEEDEEDFELPPNPNHRNIEVSSDEDD